MPDENAHSRQAVHNREFIDFLDIDCTNYLDWVVTAIFYAAVHYIESFLARYGAHPISHGNRCNAMSRFAPLKPVFKDYSDLHFQSERSRYLCEGFDRNIVKTELLGKLTSIETQIQKL